MMLTTFDQHKAYWAKKSGMPSSLVEWLPNPDGLQILDLGCGGGRLAASFTTAAQVYGIDNSADLLQQAALINPNLKFVCGDFQSEDVWNQIPQLDLVVSNCAIRKDYCPNLKTVIQKSFNKLVSKGVMLLRIEAFSDLSEVLPESVRRELFYSKQELIDCFDMFSFVIKDEAFKQRFSSQEYMNRFLERIQIKNVKANNLNPTRRYYIVRAEKY